MKDLRVYAWDDEADMYRFGYYVHLVDSYHKKESHRIYPGTSDVDCGDFYPDFYEINPTTIMSIEEYNLAHGIHNSVIE